MFAFRMSFYSVFVLDDVHEYGRNGIDVLKKKTR